jgi:hypothetical protein
VQIFIEAGEPAGQRGHGIVQSITDVAVRPECQVHRPHETPPDASLKCGVEIRVMPQADTDPHQSRFLSGTRRDAGIHPLPHLIMKGARVPSAQSVPRTHWVAITL